MTHKNRKKSRIFMFLSTGCSLLRAEGFSCSLGVLYVGLGISKLQFLIKKIEIKFPAIKFNCRPSNPGSGSGSGIRIRNQKKCWIRIRIKSMRIRNPVANADFQQPMMIRIRIRIQHFRSMRIPIQIQGFYDQKLQFTYTSKPQKKPSALKREHLVLQNLKFLPFSYQNQWGSMRIWTMFMGLVYRGSEGKMFERL